MSDLDLTLLNGSCIMMSPLITFNIDRYNSHDEWPGFIMSYKSNRRTIAMQNKPLFLNEHQ